MSGVSCVTKSVSQPISRVTSSDSNQLAR